jgi:hypothetical protein
VAIVFFLACLLLPACDAGYDSGGSAVGNHWGGGSSSGTATATGSSSGAATGTGPGSDSPWQDAGKPPGDDAGPVGTPTPPTAALTAQQCGVCHQAIYQQWQNSMHSHALTSPLTIVQTNADLAGPFAKTDNPDPQKFCVNCHGPTVSAQVTSAAMPPPASTHWKDGITCTSCHQFDGTPEKGSGAFQGSYQGSGFQQGFVQVDNEMLGAMDSPVGNSAHSSNSTGQDFAPNPNQLCANCHEVWIDYDHDGIVEKGLDLALQTTWDEYKEYKTLGGSQSCVSCHMPVVPGLTRAADSAQIPGQQYTQAPDRQVHDHSFPGVDFALDDATQGTNTLAARTAMLESAATFFIDRNSIFNSNDGIGFSVFLANSGTGHNLPSGFAFARQMWIEITATDDSGQTLFTSGVLQNPTDDLCDGQILLDFDNPMNRWIQNCRFVDDELVTLQQQLVSLAGFQPDGSDPFDPAGLTKAFAIGEETWLQYLHGGVVARQRPFDGTQLVNLKPFEQQEFQYDVPTNNAGDGLHIQARLLFRQLPPYFVRALAAGQAPTDMPQLAPLIANLPTIVMATDQIEL